MREHVPGQRTALRKPLATRFTQKGFFPCVDSHVDFQMAQKGKKLSAFITAMFFLHILALKLLFLPSARHPFVC